MIRHLFHLFLEERYLAPVPARRSGAARPFSGFAGARFRARRLRRRARGPIARGFFVRRDQRDMIHAQRLREFVEADDRRIAEAAFEIAQILLREARTLRELLLTQALFEPDPPHVPSDQPPHVHAGRLDVTHYHVYLL